MENITREMLSEQKVRKKREGGREADWNGRRETFHTAAENANSGNYRELSEHRAAAAASTNRGAIVRHYPPQIMEVSLSSLLVFLFQRAETKERSNGGLSSVGATLVCALVQYVQGTACG